MVFFCLFNFLLCLFELELFWWQFGSVCMITFWLLVSLVSGTTKQCSKSLLTFFSAWFGLLFPLLAYIDKLKPLHPKRIRMIHVKHYYRKVHALCFYLNTSELWRCSRNLLLRARKKLWCLWKPLLLSRYCIPYLRDLLPTPRNRFCIPCSDIIALTANMPLLRSVFLVLTDYLSSRTVGLENFRFSEAGFVFCLVAW